MSLDRKTKCKTDLLPISTMLKIESNPKHFQLSLKAAKVQLFLKTDFFFLYINNKNLVTNIIKSNAGLSLLL